MKSISIYALTRKQNTACLSRLEHQLSGREKPLKNPDMGTEQYAGIRGSPGRTYAGGVPAPLLLFLFQIPRLGKEFDLLQVKKKTRS